MIREAIILEYAKGKDLLDIGCMGRTMKYKLWPQVKASARSYTGIDIQTPTSADVVQGNMESYDFGRDFDVVIAGDVLEHVSNQGLFLENIGRHLRDDAVLIITTPNAKWPTVFLRTHPDHVLWHDRSTLTGVLHRAGLEIRHFQYYFGNKPFYGFFKRILTRRQGMLLICGKAKPMVK
jgi:2-polyprenyl-3-methyl-5-hydroxy-6-metoxy-1,4-benzoquinol methylase